MTDQTAKPMEDSRIAAETRQDDNMRDEQQTTNSENPHDWSELMRDATPEQVAAALLRPVIDDNPTTTTSKRKRGRPAKRTMPEPIPDTPENIMRAVLDTPPKTRDKWRYLADDIPGD